GIGAGRDVQAQLEPVSLAGSRATALALVFSELLQNALEHGAGTVRIELARRDGDVVLAIADEGAGADGAPSGTGLSIVRALVDVESGWEPELNEEHVEYRWLRREEAAELLSWPEPAALLRSLP